MDKKLFEQALKIQSSDMSIIKNEKNYAFTFIYPPSKVLYDLDRNVMNEKKIEEANLYVHIPYCTGRCTYCYFGCYEFKNAPISINSYVEIMCKEMKLLKEKYGKIKLLSIHFGGGTPTTLSNELIDIVFDNINQNFEVEKGIEITFESSPETLTEDKLKCLVKNGVNRLNIGIQTLNDELLKYINRRHNSQKAIEGINLAKSVGIININVDVMYGLKGQTMSDWTETLHTLLKTGIQSISTYRLRIHPNGKMKSDLVSFDEKKAIEMYLTMLNIMKEYGFYQCSSHKFAIKEEMAQKQIVNKRGLVKNTLVPIGMAAYGNVDNVVFWNERTMEKYVERINNGQMAFVKGYILDKYEEMAKSCVLGIHNVDGIDLMKFNKKFGCDIEEVYGELISKLKKEELIIIDGKHLKPSELGMVFADEIATEFYSQKVKDKLKDQNDKYGIFFDEILD